MRCLVLSRVMTLVLFLDFAKTQNLLDKAPRLFSVSSEVKSSRDVLVAICRTCLFAEGDIVKHLSRISLNVVYHQDPIDEVNFKVSNLATNLRDGVLLTRLSEIVTESSFKSIMTSLRLPVISRLQKKHNVNLALTSLRHFGVLIPDVIDAHHIMDGHREMVLALMWCVISHCCMMKLIQEDMVEQEIEDVLRSSLARSKVTRHLTHVSGKEPAFHRPPTAVGKRYTKAEEVLRGLVLRWSQAVCASFGLRIDDCVGSFADGTAICLLVYYYHPTLMPKEEIFFPSGNEDISHSIGGNQRREKERSNWTKAIEAIKELGGMPVMLPISDSESPPDEQSMLLCLSYLCSRLMESSKEIFATILIQAHYRKYQRLALVERKIAAAKLIISFWLTNRHIYYRFQRRRYAGAVALLEEFVLSHREGLRRMRDRRLEKELQTASATQIQVCLWHVTTTSFRVNGAHQE
jgi:abnormal spindle-like microcephaly-associated protein